jgi:hypothetical protein
MPIATRQPEALAAPTARPVERPRPGGEATLGVLPPSPGALLPAGDSLAPAPALTPARALALDALRLLRRLGDPSRYPDAWGTDAFGRDVATVRRHLAPLRTRAALAASYDREAFQRGGESLSGLDDDVGAVRVAYALRWLELGAGVVRTAQRASAITSPCGTSARSPRPRPRRHRWRSPARDTGRAT